MLEIRPFKESDAQYIIEFNEGTDENFLRQWAGGKTYIYPLTAEQITERIKNTENTRYFAITLDNEVIGACEIDSINWETKECSFCRFIIGGEFRGQGYGTRALGLIVDFAFLEFNMKKVKLSVFDFNIGAIKCYEKVGFIHTGDAVRPNGWIAKQMEIVKFE